MRRRQIMAMQEAVAAAPSPAPPPPLTPIEAAVLRALGRCGRATPRDIVRHVRGVEDAQAILNRLVELGLAARRPDDRRGPGRRAQWVCSVSTLLAMGLGKP